ncbi:MAG: Rieske 2Fe-2S domain-containing protein [Acidimicrobiales bacterium]
MAEDVGRHQPTGRFSIVRLPRHWYVACLSTELDTTPIGRIVLGLRLALFRGRDGRAVAVLDRCPHRNMPLSLGTVRAGELECRYHGWRFDDDGLCVAVPGLTDDGVDKPARRVETFPILERDGFVWVVPTHDPPVGDAPLALPNVDDAGYSTVRRSLTVDATLHAALENTLDVPHTAYLHRGLFRGGRDPVPIEVTVRHADDRVEAVFVGEPRPEGAAARLLAPEGGEVEHVDRFILPSIAQVEYRLGDNHLVITTAYTPIGDFETALHAAVTFRSRLPAGLVRALVTPIAGYILRQDAWVLRHQTANIRRFGGEQFSSTRIDLLGPHILRLLRRAERGEPAAEPRREERLTIRL